MEYPKFLVDATYEMNIRGKFHKLKPLTMDNLKAIELKYPEVITQKRTGTVTSTKNGNKIKAMIWDLTIEDVKGYSKNPNQKNWKDCVPFPDKVKVGGELDLYKICDETDLRNFFPDIPKESDPENVRMFAISRQANRDIPLIHEFKMPTESDVEDFENITELDTRIKKNKVVMKTRPIISRIVDLYDRLIVNTYGYDVMLPDSTFEISQIPGNHKDKAVTTMFLSVLGELEETEGN
jgi:hypothetical protein